MLPFLATLTVMGCFTYILSFVDKEITAKMYEVKKNSELVVVGSPNGGQVAKHSWCGHL